MKTLDRVSTSPTKRRSKFFWGGSIIIVCCLVGILMYAVFFSSSADKQKIHQVLDNRASALTQKDLPRYLSCFSPNYRSGSRTYEDLKANASRWFVQFENIHFSFQVIDIQLQGDKAIVENNYKFSLINVDGEPLEISQRELLELQRNSKEWKITQSLSIQ